MLTAKKLQCNLSKGVTHKVIQAEDALNLNALLLSGNSSKLFSTDLTRKRMPPMTSSILMTINKCEFSSCLYFFMQFYKNCRVIENGEALATEFKMLQNFIYYAAQY
ncbi:hypothetical protein TELCIR_23267 [Teladorsagia circumcincta]|uniref:Uncharacterized protein n=1 Tax=Teladorsagia circumcincta TaxID=45464 RepID=A0A2G9TBK7_TELCI|nr:hypothetical protein TELCIR_23267 [Teladorsagia circumcincta]